VGAEHYCEAWHGWHCAAVPIVDIVTSDALGVIDISGFSRNAHPHTLQLAVALASSVREMLTAREMEHRVAVLTRFAQLSGRYVNDALVAVDRHGHVLHASDAAPAGLRPGTDTPRALRSAIADHVEAMRLHGHVGDSTEVFLALDQDIGVSALSFPVFDRQRVVGACLLLRSGATARERGGSSSSPFGVPAASGTGRHPVASEPVRASSRSLVHTAASAEARADGRGESRYALRDIVGTSARMTEAVRLANAAAGNSLPVFISGESGTGKEVFAQSIHAASTRRSRPFIAVNCAALPRELIEAELFGYVGGAFTGARREGSPGKFRAAEGGTIFLDEISEMPYSAQAALLRVLQEQEISAVGSSAVRPINVRVIAATNRDVVDAVRTGLLRPDLYYRLNVLTIELPALRERRADIPALATHLLAQAASELGRPSLAFADGMIEHLAQRDWPGNVRELKNYVRRMASLSPDDLITLDLDAMPVRTSLTTDGGAGTLDDAERARTVAAMQTARSMHDAAQKLGINRSTLYRRLERYGLKAERLLRAQ